MMHNMQNAARLPFLPHKSIYSTTPQKAREERESRCIGYRNQQGFTLIEILIALFIMTILSTILIQTLHHVIAMQSDLSKKSEQLHEIQMTVFRLSHDFPQMVNQPYQSDAHTKPEAAFIGEPTTMAFTRTTHLGITKNTTQAFLERNRYKINNHALWRTTTPIQNNEAIAPHERLLLSGIVEGHFEYLDKEGRFCPTWPPQKKSLPRAVRVSLVLSKEGSFSQLYVIHTTFSDAARLTYVQ